MLKPLDGNQGGGVCLNLHNEEDVREAFAIARAHSDRVIVEQLFTGRDYRVLVVDGRLIAASEKVPPHVVGDGRHTISELIDLLNQDPRRGDEHSKPLSRIRIDPVLNLFSAGMDGCEYDPDRQGNRFHSVTARTCPQAAKRAM